MIMKGAIGMSQGIGKDTYTFHCTVKFDGNHPFGSKAQAEEYVKLIAAAPELLEACRGIIST
jgi:hypothetical protein